MLDAQHLRFAYPQQAPLIDNLSLTIPEHQITTLLGPNGSGKSTLLKLLTRQLSPQAGHVHLAGQDLWRAYSAQSAAQQIAVVHQHHELYDELTVADLIQLGRLPYQSSLFADPAPADTAAIMAELQLTALADRPVKQLSGGQAQRVWLALALNQEPTYLFLDEPTTYLDLHYQTEFLRLLRQLNQQRGLTIVMILHDLNQALRYSDYCCLLDHGQLVATGTPQRVLTPARIKTTFQLECDLITTKYGPVLIQA